MTGMTPRRAILAGVVVFSLIAGGLSLAKKLLVTEQDKQDSPPLQAILPQDTPIKSDIREVIAPTDDPGSVPAAAQDEALSEVKLPETAGSPPLSSVPVTTPRNTPTTSGEDQPADAEEEVIPPDEEMSQEIMPEELSEEEPQAMPPGDGSMPETPNPSSARDFFEQGL